MAANATITLDLARFNAAARKLALNSLPAAVDKMIRAAALRVVGEITKSLNGEEAGYDVPKRIDTGRYRAAWSVTTRDVFGVSGGPASGGQAGDGSGSMSGTALTRKVTLSNAVEYGAEIEYGTSRMRPGTHVRRAVRVVRGELTEATKARALIARAWRA